MLKYSKPRDIVCCMLELRKPEIKLYVEGSEIAFVASTYTRGINEIVKNLPYRRWDFSKKRWLVLPQSYYRFLGGLKSLNLKVIADPSCEQLVEKYTGSMATRLSLKELKEVELGTGTNFIGKLFPFQTVGANFLYRCRRALLGDPVGLGKTPTAIASAIVALQQNKIDFVFVITTASTQYKWLKELKKFTDLKAIDSRYPRKRREITYRGIFGSREKNYFFLVISYSTLTTDIDTIMSLVGEHDVRYCAIFDEVQACKHSGSHRSKAAKRLANRAKHLYALSATYIEGRLEELYHVFDIVNSTVLGTYDHYYNTHIWETPWGKTCYRNLGLVRETIAPHVIRRLVEEVGVQMPREVFQEYMITLTPSQQRMYQGLVEQHMREYSADPNPLVEMIRERQCCLSTELIDPETRESPKLIALLEALDALEKDAKSIVFCHFLQMVEILVRELRAYGLKQDPPFTVLKLRSGMSANEMDRVRDEFETNPAARILVTSDISKEGHDLVAARHVFNFDLLWNPASMRQRAGRIIRITQKASQVVIHTLITRGTVEDYMWEVVYDKGEIMKAIQDGGREESRVTRKRAIEILENYRG